VAVVGYADDITILVTTSEDIEVIREIIQYYDSAAGALLIVRKSQSLAVGNWDPTRSVLAILYSQVIKILDLQMTKKTETSRRASWSTVTAKVKAHAREAYHRDLGLLHCILYAHAYLLANIWHTSQIFPIRKECVQQIAAAVVSYIWLGSIFRMPVSTLQRWKEEGGWGMIDMMVKCRALLLARMLAQSHREGSAPAEWLQNW
jgi:hypothetical protein